LVNLQDDGHGYHEGLPIVRNEGMKTTAKGLESFHTCLSQGATTAEGMKGLLRGSDRSWGEEKMSTSSLQKKVKGKGPRRRSNFKFTCKRLAMILRFQGIRGKKKDIKRSRRKES